MHLTYALKHDHGHGDSSHGVWDGESLSKRGSWRRMAVADQGENHQGVVEGSRKFPLGTGFMRLFFHDEQFHDLVVFWSHVVLVYELRPVKDQESFTLSEFGTRQESHWRRCFW